jgi:hypothetical protein
MISSADSNKRWADGLVVVGFDLEEGQVMNDHYPIGFLDEKTLKYITSISFPDTCNFSSEGKHFFFFNVRSIENKELYCFALFTQKKDPTNPRGYHQSSIVVVSQIRHICIMHSVITELSNAYNSSENKNEVILSFYNQINDQSELLKFESEQNFLSLDIDNKKISVLDN